MTTLHVGDQVTWNTAQGPTEGKIVDRRTSDFQLAGQQFRASNDEPMFVVESDATGARAAHRPDALERKG
jgi:surface antigen